VTTTAAVFIGTCLWGSKAYYYGSFIANPAPALAYHVALWLGPGVPAAWFLLALSRRWRYERGWIDTLGMFLGLYWFLDGFIFSHVVYLY
jgi:hypothetical protein